MTPRRPEPVSISNPGFFIANVMKDCPANTVIRELLQNAIEACDGGRIEWFVADWHGQPKLGLFNEGSGMDHLELTERMNIASSGKELGHYENFGQGAKMSAAKASPYGLIYRSCKHEMVHQIWLQVQDQPGGNKLLVKVPQTEWCEDDDGHMVQEAVIVKNVTDDAMHRGRQIDTEWTEAILLGRSEEDNTLDGSFLGASGALWLMAAINHRFY